MANTKQNPLIGAFRTPVAESPPPGPAKEEKATEAAKAAVVQKQVEAVKPPETAMPVPSKVAKAADKSKAAPSAPASAPKEKPTTAPKAKASEVKAAASDGKTGVTVPPPASSAEKQVGEVPKEKAAAKPLEPDKKATKSKAAAAAEVPKPSDKTAKDTAKPQEAAAEAKPADKAAKDTAKSDAAAPAKPNEKPQEDKKAEESKDPNVRFVPLSKIVPLPGTYVKDKPREDYGDLIASIQKNGLEKPVILRKGENDEFQLVDGFHRCKALEKAGMLEIKADLYEMPLPDASRYRKEHRANPNLPIPGKLVPVKPPEPEIPEDFRLPITKEGQSELITTLKVAEIHPFEGHPFNVKDDKDMMDLADSVKKFGVLEPVVVIPRREGGFEMVSGHRRRRACELAGIATMPVIVRQLDRDEAVISMVDANLKRENISPMEKARAYQMKLEAMKRKAGRRSKEEAAALAAAGVKPMRADEELAQQTGESRSNIQKLVRLNNLTPALQQMVEEKKLPVHTASDLSYLKKEEQAAVADAIGKEAKVPSGAQAAELKKASQAGTLTADKIEKAVAPTKREQNPPLKITLSEEELRPYFPDKRTTIPDAKRGVLEALDLRKKALERQKAQAERDGKAKKPPSPAR